jgi:hypothetical protein
LSAARVLAVRRAAPPNDGGTGATRPGPDSSARDGEDTGATAPPFWCDGASRRRGRRLGSGTSVASPAATSTTASLLSLVPTATSASVSHRAAKHLSNCWSVRVGSVRSVSAYGARVANASAVSLRAGSIRRRSRSSVYFSPQSEEGNVNERRGISSEGERLAPVSTRRREFPALALTQELQRGRGVARDRDVFTRFRGAAMDRERGAGGVRQDAKAERSPRANE